MKQGKIAFPNGLTIVYVYPDETHPNIQSTIQLHFGFNNRYGKTNNATFSDALAALDGIKNDLSQLQEWIIENGLPKYFSGATETQLLIRILKEAGLHPTQEIEGGMYSFKLETTGMTIQEVFQRMNHGIDSVQQYAHDLEGRRNKRKE